MTESDQSLSGSGRPDPDNVIAHRAWGPAPRRWDPANTSVKADRVSTNPLPRRSALTPIPEDDDAGTTPRRSALTPIPEDDDAGTTPRRSALTPIPEDDDAGTTPRRSALTPLPDDDGGTTPRRSALTPLPDDEDDTSARRSALTPIPEDGEDSTTPRRSAISPLGDEDFAATAPRRSAISPSHPDEHRATTPKRSAFKPLEEVTPLAAPEPLVADDEPVPLRSGDDDDIPAGHEETLRLPLPRRSHEYSNVVNTLKQSETAKVSTPSAPEGDHSGLTSAVAEQKVEDLAVKDESDTVKDESDTKDTLEEQDSSILGENTATWLFGSALSDGDHSLYTRPGPGEPETEVDLTPIIINDPEYDVGKGLSPTAKSATRPGKVSPKKQNRGISARRVRFVWRDHKRLLAIGAVVLSLLLIVWGVGSLLTLANRPLSAITEGKLSLPSVAGSYIRDPTKGVTPSADPNSKIQTVSATYTLNGEQQFVAIAYRPQTDPSAALEEIQARNISKVNGGACGRTVEENRVACAVVSGTTAVLLVTLVGQSSDGLITAAQSVATGIGKD